MSEEPEDVQGQGENEEIIEGGHVGPIDELPFEEHKHRAQTARAMAFLLVWIMAISVAVHFLATAALAASGNKEAVESLATIFTMWLPVIAGMVSSAVTYYFTKENQK